MIERKIGKLTPSSTLTWALLLLWMSSCYSRKELIYLQDPTFSNEYPTQIKNRRPTYKLQTNDVLHIDIQNPDTESAQFFNYGQEGMQAFGNQLTLFVQGHSVDEGGYVTVPLVGKVKVEDLTVDEAKNLLQQEVDKFLRNTSVDVKLISFKISVMGEVNNPGYYYVYNGQANVLEGLSLAGDLTDFGSRSNIKLIRQNENGAEVILLDLTNSDMMKSKYYYLLPNDVIYVEPSTQQLRRENLVPIGIVFTAITSLALLANVIINFSNTQNNTP